jgi:ubiquinone/menaquinone biosynthesis C-methylase UbiE
MWQRSHPITEWMIRKLEPRPGATILDLAAGLADTYFMAAHLVGQTGHVIITDFAPDMVTSARRRAEELGVKNAEFQVLVLCLQNE